MSSPVSRCRGVVVGDGPGGGGGPQGYPFRRCVGALGGFLKGYHEGLRVLHQGIAGGLDGDDPDGVPHLDSQGSGDGCVVRTRLCGLTEVESIPHLLVSEPTDTISSTTADRLMVKVAAPPSVTVGVPSMDAVRAPAASRMVEEALYWVWAISLSATRGRG